MDPATIPGASPGIKLLMSWVPTIFIFISAAIMAVYPLTKEKMAAIETELAARRGAEPA
jgi:GPH family glycoside/pentoside/hexuronide:cation symporter